MSDDSFFREVSEELRQDRVKAIWTRFGAYILVAIVLIVAVTAGVVGWQRYQTAQANASGDAYLAALQLADDEKPDQAIAALKALTESGVGAYPDLARMSIGAVNEKAGKSAEAVAAFEEVAKDSSAPQPIRDMADLRAAYILVDSGSLEQVRAHAERLTGDSEPLRFAAREAIALSAWKAGDVETAKPLLKELGAANDAPNGISGRARLLLDVIEASTPAPEMGSSGNLEPEAQTSDSAGAPRTEDEPVAAAGDDGSSAALPAGTPSTSTSTQPEEPASVPAPAAPTSDGTPSLGVTMPTTGLGQVPAEPDPQSTPADATSGSTVPGAEPDASTTPPSSGTSSAPAATSTTGADAER